MAAPSLSVTWRNGAFHKESAIPLSDRGFRYGLALFETLRISRHRSLFVPEHLAELRRSAISSGWWNSDALPEAALEAAARWLAGQETVLPEDGIARIHLTAGDGGFTDITEEPRLFLTAHSRSAPDAQFYETGLTARIHPEPLPTSVPGLKSHNYWPNLSALRQAAALGFQEAILAEADGEIRGFCLGNLFAVHGSQIITPRLESGCRAGVVREWVLRQLGGAVESDRMTVEHLHTADSIFMANSGLGVVALKSLDERELKVSERIKSLQLDFARLL